VGSPYFRWLRAAEKCLVSVALGPYLSSVGNMDKLLFDIFNSFLKNILYIKVTYQAGPWGWPRQLIFFAAVESKQFSHVSL
jgi:hypothetical protein